MKEVPVLEDLLDLVYLEIDDVLGRLKGGPQKPHEFVDVKVLFGDDIQLYSVEARCAAHREVPSWSCSWMGSNKHATVDPCVYDLSVLINWREMWADLYCRTMVLERVKETIERYGMIAQGDRVVVGVSGGVDSVALVSVLNQLRTPYKISLLVAHVNHQLRGEESKRDEGFVRGLAMKLGLPFQVRSVPLRELKKRGTTLQEAAREARFSFFNTLIEKHHAHRIATGQTADDQAETMVMRFIRGAGMTGLKGIPPVRTGGIIHPLIEVTREEIEAYVVEQGLTHVEDSSNRRDAYLRNRVRNHLMPILEDYNPNLGMRLNSMGRILLQEDDYMRAKTDALWHRIVRRQDDSVILKLDLFRKVHPALQRRLLMRGIASESGTDAKRIAMIHVLSLVNLALHGGPHGELHLPGGVRARRIYGELEIGKRKTTPAPTFNHPVRCPGKTSIGEISQCLISEFVDQWNPEEASSNCVFMDYGHLEVPLRVRNFRRGDRFRPFGTTGPKKLKDCFIDWKVPMGQRLRTPLVVSGDEIVWVAGHRMSHDARLTATTERVIRLELRAL